MAPIQPSRLCLPLILFVLTLGGCATTPSPAPSPAQSTPAQEAEELAAAGRSEAAAQRFERAARTADDSATADRYRLRAALLYLDAGRGSRSRGLLAAARRSEGLSQARDTQAMATLLEVRLDESLPPPKIIETLSPVPEALPAPVAAAWLETLAAAELDAGQALQAARHRVQRSTLIGRRGRDTAVSEGVWAALQRVPQETLRGQVPAVRPDRFGAWLELAWAVRGNSADRNAVESAVAAWRRRYPDHPAHAFIDELMAKLGERLSAPENVTLLLPLSGDLGDVGRAIRDGFLTSLYALPANKRPALEILDTQGTAAGATAAYRRAPSGSAVVGPLTKDAVRAVLAQHAGERLLLALNTVATQGTTANAYQFGLSPEDDARTAAEAAWNAGIERAVLLAPQGAWGDRVANAYQQAFSAVGGGILETARYDGDGADYSDTLRRLFNLDVSERRYRELRRVLNRDLQFEPSRRADMQALFIAAFPREARLIVPQVRFHHGLDLPVYATSHAYPKPADDAARQDLEALRLVELPWLMDSAVDDTALAELQQTAMARWPESARNMPELVALGVDAGRLIQRVGTLALAPGRAIRGATGRLTLGSDGVVHRTPMVVTVTGDGLKPLQVSERQPAMNDEASPQTPETTPPRQP
ncbi:penicillin-binding protein activator [Arhodomonas sp. AD133]|uniref:penicillin-binding protein activator n=1 Tax=Arhodomonas sp. AD133 TaxID=3415009 RepID=UPI003EBDFA85